MSPSATPATQSAAASPATKTDPSAPPSAISATPATQNERGCEIVPRLPRKVPQNDGRCEFVLCMWQMVCVKFVYVKNGMWVVC